MSPSANARIVRVFIRLGGNAAKNNCTRDVVSESSIPHFKCDKFSQVEKIGFQEEDGNSGKLRNCNPLAAGMNASWSSSILSHDSSRFPSDVPWRNDQGKGDG